MELPSVSLALCVVCQGFLTDAVHVVCKGGCGVKLCEGCWEGFALANGGRPKCPMCSKATFPDLTRRDCTLNNILDKCLRPCTHCTDFPLGTAAEIARHEAVCPCRPVRCSHVECCATLRHCDALAHEASCPMLSCGEEGLGEAMGVRFGCRFRGTPPEVQAHRSICGHRRPELQDHLRRVQERVAAHLKDVQEAMQVEDAMSWAA